ncbi:MAG TPA: hypothetical protein VF337_04915 [Candidatus Limnocylindrales bacterium]
MDSLAIIALTVGLPLVIVIGAFWYMRGDTATIKDGIQADAIVESLAETGTTISTPSLGPDTPVFDFGLLVSPPGGAPYRTSTKHAVPRLYVPLVMPGARIGVMIDSKKPLRVVPDWSRPQGSGATPGGGAMAGAAGPDRASAPGAGAVTMSFDGAPTADGSLSAAAAPGSIPGATPTLSFDAAGNPTAGGVESLVGAVRSGAVPTIKGSYETIIATGTRGTAVITTAMPFGKTAGQLNPAVNPARFNFPVWVFTIEVTLAGQGPFPAVFGHFVPPEKLSLLGPDVKLAVAVDPRNQYQDVAIVWDQSPIAG